MALEILLAYHFPEDSGLLFEKATVQQSNNTFLGVGGK